MLKNGIQFDINMYEILKKSTYLINTIPITTVSVEQSFSTMNRVITGQETLLARKGPVI